MGQDQEKLPSTVYSGGKVIMSKPSDRKRRKQKAHQQVEAKKKYLADQQRIYAQKFPRFIFRENGAPPEFVKLVKQAIKNINFRNPQLFSRWETEIYKMGKQYGPGAIKVLDGNLSAQIFFKCKLGHIVFFMIPQEKLLQWIPFHDVQIMPSGHQIVVSFRSLMKAKGPGGTIYHSRYKPTIQINGKRKIVGFSEHAIQRICERIVPTWHTYAGLGDAFAYFDQCVYFQRVDLPDGQLALTFFDQCKNGFFSWKYVEEILGEDIVDDGHYYRRIGYCPAVIENGFIKAKTLLFPGHRNTPEHRLVWASDVSVEVKRQVEDMDAVWLRMSEDFRLVKFFHQRGVPQVIHDERVFFRSSI